MEMNERLHTHHPKATMHVTSGWDHLSAHLPSWYLLSKYRRAVASAFYVPRR